MQLSTNPTSHYPHIGKWKIGLTSYFKTSLTLIFLFFGFSLSSNAQNYSGKIYQHWADGDAATSFTPQWQGDILSANKSDYFEGEVIPHVAILQGSTNSPLVKDQSYQFTVVYNYYQDNTNAGGFAFMTTYNKSRQPAVFSDGLNQAPTLDPIPSGSNSGGIQGDFYSNNANVTAVSAPVPSSSSGTFDQTVTVTFTYTGTTGGYAEIYYGLYVAKPGMVPNQGKGKTAGAHAWTGGSLQTTLDASPFGGASSIQLSPDAIIEGKISGLKYSDLNNSGSRDDGEPGLQNWTIQLDNDADATNGVLETATTDANGNFSFSVIPGTYYVREVQQNGWTQTQPASNGQYGPIVITALAPQSTNNIFGNYQCVQPSATATSDAKCSSSVGGTTATFDLSSYESTVKGNQSNVTVTWYSDADLKNQITGTDINSYTVNGSADVYAKVSLNFASSCYNSAKVSLAVNTTPNAYTASDAKCSSSTSSLQASFNLNDYVSNVAGTQTGVVVSWFTDQALQNKITDPSSFSATGATTTVYARVSNSNAASCYSSAAVTLTINSSVGLTALSPLTKCQGESAAFTSTASGYNATGGDIRWYKVVNNVETQITTGITVDGQESTLTLSSVKTSDAGTYRAKIGGTGLCGTDSKDGTLTVNDCSKITVQKLTKGAIDNTRSWTFGLYNGPNGFGTTPIAQQTISATNNSLLFSNVVLSSEKKYTLCELGVVPTAGWAYAWKVDTNGDGIPDATITLSDIYNPDASKTPSEDLGNRCIEIGAGTSYPLPTNIYGTTYKALAFEVNNIPPPGGNARTPGYWKNWNTCTGGNQAQTAAKNGGPAAGYFILDNHLPMTLWANADVAGTSYTSCGSFTSFDITTCAKAVQVLNTQDNKGKNMSSDAAYNLAKHLLAYLLNKKSGTYDCAAAETAKNEAKALLASVCFDASKSYLDSKVTGALATKRTRALDLASVLDAYNNNKLICISNNIITTSRQPDANVIEDSKLFVSASPNPFTDKIRFTIQAPKAGRATLEVYNLLGQKVGVPFEGQLNAGETRSVDYTAPVNHRSSLIYRLSMNGEQISGKLMSTRQ